MRLDRKRLHLVRHDREAASRLAGARGLDRCVERQQVRLLCDLGNKSDHRSDFRGRALQAVDARPGVAGGLGRMIGQIAGELDLASDLAGRLSELFSSRSELLNILIGYAHVLVERHGTSADRF